MAAQRGGGWALSAPGSPRLGLTSTDTRRRRRSRGFSGEREERNRPALPALCLPGLPAEDLADTAVADPELPRYVAGSHPLVSQLHYPLPHHIR